jgi:hypothetical protein
LFAVREGSPLLNTRLLLASLGGEELCNVSHGISWAGLEDIVDSLVEDILKAV